MCLVCIEIAKGQVTNDQFWGFFKEVMESDDPEHANGFMNIVNKLPQEMKIRLAQDALERNKDAKEENSEKTNEESSNRGTETPS